MSDPLSSTSKPRPSKKVTKKKKNNKLLKVWAIASIVALTSVAFLAAMPYLQSAADPKTITMTDVSTVYSNTTTYTCSLVIVTITNGVTYYEAVTAQYSTTYYTTTVSGNSTTTYKVITITDTLKNPC